MKLSWLIFVLLMPVTAVFAAEQSGTADNLRIIQVDGHGIARSDPDQAFMSFAIETKGSTAKEAVEQNAAIASKVVAALKSKLAPGGQGGNWRLLVDAVIWTDFSAVAEQNSRLDF